MAMTETKPEAQQDPWEAITAGRRRPFTRGMPKGRARIAVLGGGAALLAAALTTGITGLVLDDARTDASNALQKAVTAAQPRTDLSVQLTQVLRGDAPLEQAAIDRVIAARNKVLVNDPGQDGGSRGFSRYVTAEADLGSSLEALVKVARTHPKLKDAAPFTDLTKQLDAATPGIAEATTAYNDASARYNGIRESFPGSVVAPMLGHGEPWLALWP